MKHIKKKFRFEKTLSEEEMNDFNTKHYTVNIEEAKSSSIQSNLPLYLVSDVIQNKIIGGFMINLDGKKFIIPEPDPTLIQFDFAYNNLRLLKESKQKLKDKLSEKLTEDINISLYQYFGYCHSFIISLFTSIESFINSRIPDSYIHIVETKQKTETFNKNQIERYLDFNAKLKKVLPDIFTKDFQNSPKFTHMMNLKEFRDMLVHIKSDNDSSTPFEYIYKKSLNFKYDDTILAVRDFMNFYEPNYIEQCNCGNDF